MFTGLVQELGTVAALEPQADALRLSIRAPQTVSDAHLGDSIAINGVCLTIAELDGDIFCANVMRESLDRTGLGQLEEGARVNVEPAVLPTTRLGGHIMQGHVDGTARLVSREHSEHWDVLRFSLPRELTQYVVEKGSIAVNGTSLTVSAVGKDWFEVSLIPTTLRETTHGESQPGDIVNLEVDVLAKYVEKMLHPESGSAQAKD
ncbi:MULTISPECIES: riboflavin synthase [unclassified Corynebacterium]|uniref:riboflavin synthase n=1 Tax=Corynebacterium TaxID=1716 RepID=UPI00254D2073|nr:MULTISPECIES: riboflavin synthase [unclassified Corynebacterium]MDK8452190.1 riboflavin synthase [Corynebacterium sp. MSK084]MDK8475339.1 riboflavin synthase [Corynebacterium sp. MSK310]MDK8492155.1 riboflavin synthase [Corynebacterium sp. MSK175]MDK8514127.1 riboflavin synthase [Corynebacterium sp. MSK123]MDK8547125.1 riboflavin synthase [Corynebacterium sp. MSK222]